MRKYTSQNEKKIEVVKCNKCGAEIKKQDDMLLEGVCRIEIEWGYFSNKDGEIHAFNLCEGCYDEWVRSFAIPLQIDEAKELL